ncbi:DUF692 family protein [Fibrella sp. HMF5036]|uniref:DUF692 family protein n=2 Tax=Fibrella aquatilis TaxID=2817059 RepID=A0A939G3B8_9BACT|nr:DUF692 family protein [Fibrella aquatilis]
MAAALPLFEAGEVGAIEWAFDSLYRYDELPGWFADLLTTYGEAGRLVGHGVFFSLFSGQWTPEQAAWLTSLRALSQRFRFDHVTEHFGFMTGANFHQGAPLGVPCTPQTLALGRDRLQRIQDACGCPVGLENLAFAYAPDEVKQHGEFLRQLIEPINGFIILDLHNLYCQLMNFDISAPDLLALYPLDRVREIHISGGSWHDSAADPTRAIRRDTHDDAVPDAVFNLLTYVMDQCPNLRFVVLEQLGTALDTDESRQQFRADFRRMDAIVKAMDTDGNGLVNSFLPPKQASVSNPPLTDAALHAQQRTLATILETATDYQQAQTRLASSELAHTAWQPERWQPAMLETAIAIAQKWRRGIEGKL